MEWYNLEAARRSAAAKRSECACALSILSPGSAGVIEHTNNNIFLHSGDNFKGQMQVLAKENLILDEICVFLEGSRNNQC